MKIVNFSKKQIICNNASLADTVPTRLVGLLNRKTLPSGEGLVITRCRSIHMFFMRFTIDVIFTDRKDKVVGLVQKIKPFRMSPYFFKAKKAIEVAPGTIEQTSTEIGDQIIFGD